MVLNKILDQHLSSYQIILKLIHQLERSGNLNFFFFIFSSGSNPVQWSEPLLVILVQGHERNISVKFF